MKYTYFVVYRGDNGKSTTFGNCQLHLEAKITYADIQGLEGDIKKSLNLIGCSVRGFWPLDVPEQDKGE
jgi:hypothetical protein